MHQLQLCATQVGRLAESCCPTLTCACWGASSSVREELVRHFRTALGARVGSKVLLGALSCVERQGPQRAEAH